METALMPVKLHKLDLYQLSFYLIQLHSYIFKYNSMVAEPRSVVYGGSTVV